MTNVSVKGAVAHTGVALVAIGPLLPFTHVGYLDLNALARGPGLLLLAIAAVSAAFTIARQYRGLLICGFAALATLGIHYLSVRVSAVKLAAFSSIVSRALQVPPGFSPSPGVLPQIYVLCGFWLAFIGAILLILPELSRPEKLDN